MSTRFGPWLRFAALNLLRNRRRSLMTAFIVALGTAALLLASGFALYTYDALAQVTVRDSGHLIVGTPQQFAQDENRPLQHGLDDVPALVRRLRADPAVRHVLPRVEFSGLVSNGEKSTGMVAVAFDPAAEAAARGRDFVSLVDGAPLEGTAPGRVLLAQDLAHGLKARPGSRLKLLATDTRGALNMIDVEVQGLFSTGVPEMDRRLLYTDLATAQRLLASPRVSTLRLFLGSLDQVAPAQARLAAQLPALAVRSWLDEAAFYKNVQALYHRIFGALGLIIGVIVVCVVAGAMAMAVMERTREIGTLRALGTLPGQLLRVLALEGLLLGGAGALAGAALALGVALALQVAPVQMPPPPGRSVGYPLQVAIDPALYAGTVAAMALLAMAASAVVARRTVRRPIVEALAHV